MGPYASSNSTEQIQVRLHPNRTIDRDAKKALRAFGRASSRTLDFMNAPSASGKMNRTGIYLTGAIILAIGIFSSLNQPGGPITETTGTIQASGFAPNDGPPTQLAAVQLQDGSVIQATVSSSVLIIPGQLARLRVYRRTLSGGQTYEVIGMEGK